MKMKEIREKPKGELLKLLAALREKMREMRFKVAAKQHKDVRELRSVKQDIARILLQLHTLETTQKNTIKK